MFCSKTGSHRVLRAAVLVAACSAIPASAALLTDGEMYFDPGSIVPDFYTRHVLDDLSVLNTITFDAGSDPIIGARVLPMLRPGEYSDGYAYSQADYGYTPNSDYYADLTAGQLAATFTQPGLYHVRTYRASGQVDTFSVFAESEFKELEGKPDPAGNNKAVDPLPDADLFLVDVSDKAGQDSAKIWKAHGRTVVEVTSRADAAKKIREASEKAHRKIHAELDGHGNVAIMSVGGGKTPTGATSITASTAAQFAKEIQPYCNFLTFQGCLVGKGQAGTAFLTTIATTIGRAGGWDSTVSVVDTSGFAVSATATFKVEIPAPSGAVLCIGGLLFAARRRRD